MLSSRDALSAGMVDLLSLFFFPPPPPDGVL